MITIISDNQFNEYVDRNLTIIESELSRLHRAEIWFSIKRTMKIFNRLEPSTIFLFDFSSDRDFFETFTGIILLNICISDKFWTPLSIYIDTIESDSYRTDITSQKVKQLNDLRNI